MTFEFLNEFQERMEYVSIMTPLIQLSNKRKYDELKLPLVSIGFAVLLFILEVRLSGKKGTTYSEMKEFLKLLCKEEWGVDFSDDEAEDFMNDIVRESLWKNGAAHEVTFWNFAEHKEDVYQFHLLMYAEYDTKDRTTLIDLSPECLNFLFTTREIFNELRISLQQLFLRVQIEKGTFDEATREADSLVLSVEDEKTRIRLLRERIARDALAVANEDAYRKQIERINSTLKHEQESFAELKVLVEDTLQNRLNENNGEKEWEVIEKIRQVQRRLGEAVTEHESLFREKIGLQNAMTGALESILYEAFYERINIERELLSPIVSRRIPLSRLGVFFDPMYSLKFHKSYHPGRMLDAQRVRRKIGDRKEEEVVSEDVKKQWMKEEEAKREQEEMEYRGLLYALLLPLIGKEEVSISDILQEPRPFSFYAKFLPMMVMLHQMGEIPLEKPEAWATFAVDPLPRAILWMSRNKKFSTIPGFQIVSDENGSIELPFGNVSNFRIRKVTVDVAALHG